MSTIFSDFTKFISGKGFFHCKKKILFISQPLFKDEKEDDTFDYFCRMLGSLCVHITGLNDYDFVVKIPSTIHTWGQQKSFLDECIANSDEYKYIILSPYNRSHIVSNVISLLQRRNKKSVFIIDKTYSDDQFYEEFYKNKVDRPYYVMANWFEGGKLAGEEMVQFIENTYSEEIISNCQILLVHGNDCHEREDSFDSVIDKYSKDDRHFHAITHKIDGDFLRETAKAKFIDWVKVNKNNIKHKPLLGIFASNDEMALGVRLGIIELKGQSYFTDYQPKIIGFDGSKEVMLLISEKDKYLHATVNLKLEQQVAELVGLIKDLDQNHDIKQPEDIPCVLFK